MVFDKCHGDWTVYTKQVLSQVKKKKSPVNGIFFRDLPGSSNSNCSLVVGLLGKAFGAFGEYPTPTCSASSRGG